VVFIEPEVFIEQGQACTVIAAVFESFQAFDKDWISFAGANIAYNSTHYLRKD
jgi:hypothetical protein